MLSRTPSEDRVMRSERWLEWLESKAPDRFGNTKTELTPERGNITMIRAALVGGLR